VYSASCLTLPQLTTSRFHSVVRLGETHSCGHAHKCPASLACLSGLMVVPLLYSHRHPVTSSPRGDDLLHSRIHGLDGRIYSLTKSKGKSTSKENTGECELGINSEKEHQAYRSIPSRTPCSKTSQYIATISPQYLTPSHHASHPQSQSPLYMLKSLLS